MRKYLLGTGILGALLGGISLIRDLDKQVFTWRTALAWISWSVSLQLAIAHILDIRTASRGGTVDPDSPIAGREPLYDRTISAEVARTLMADRKKAAKAEIAALKKFEKQAKKAAAR